MNLCDLPIILLACMMIGVQSSPINTSVESYLEKYGYINDLIGTGRDRGSKIKSGLLRFQEYNGLDQTGVLDDATNELINQPRCGVSDIDPSEGVLTFRRRPTRNKWNRKLLTYAIGSLPEELSFDARGVETQITQAFKKWSDVSGMSFHKADSYRGADIQIDFMKGRHGDGNAFDGPSGVLAHAFFPGSGGDIHFDDAETWALTRPRRPMRSYTQLYQVAVHEIGHSLGLGHSRDKSAIMAPMYKSWISSLRLGQDDILEVQRRYGPAKESEIDSQSKNEVKYDESRVHFG
eukprot:TRINITY_DN18857_c0_g1_i1.p1 TRINITY_DN18857_c0_g1~~TRINITY_DN18857_c0_g1_i1.p1  ORF type:complete len:292 (-),score=39.01 TRINITY_DN18857_c0_g1_i1:3-878(-)